MQLATVWHLLLLLVPVAVLLTLNILGIEPSKALESSLATLSVASGVSSAIGYAKDRIALKRTGAPTRRQARAEVSRPLSKRGVG